MPADNHLTNVDHTFLAQALELARSAMEENRGGPFGAVVVKDGKVVGTGRNEVTGTCDPTAHAEIMAIRVASARLRKPHLTGATIYTSCEPCPMCLGAILWARIDRIVYAGTREDAAAGGFDDAAFFEEIANPTRVIVTKGNHSLRQVARDLFALWQAKPDRTSY